MEKQINVATNDEILAELQQTPLLKKRGLLNFSKDQDKLE